MAAPWSSSRIRASGSNRYPFDQENYKSRNVIERSIGRSKDFRATATRYDKTVRNFLAGIYFAAVVIWWISWVQIPKTSPSSSCSRRPA